MAAAPLVKEPGSHEQDAARPPDGHRTGRSGGDRGSGVAVGAAAAPHAPAPSASATSTPAVSAPASSASAAGGAERALPAALERAVGGAAVTAGGVAVVAGLRALDEVVPADDVANARHPDVRTAEAGLDDAEVRAPVAGDVVAVVAALVEPDHAVAADGEGRPVEVQIERGRRARATVVGGAAAGSGGSLRGVDARAAARA